MRGWITDVLVAAAFILYGLSAVAEHKQTQQPPQPTKWVEGVPVFEPEPNATGWSTVVCRRENTVVIGAERLE